MKVFHIKNSNSATKNQNISTRTIDKKHSQMIERFEHIETTIIPELQTQLETLKQQKKT